MSCYTIEFADGTDVPGAARRLFVGPLPRVGDRFAVAGENGRMRVRSVEHIARLQPTDTFAVRVVVTVEFVS